MSSLKALEVEYAFFVPLENPDIAFLVWLENIENLEKLGNLQSCQNLRETQGNLNSCRKKNGKRRKYKICDINVNKNVFQQTLLSRVTQGKV